MERRRKGRPVRRRAYTDQEALALIKEAFHALFVTLPAIQSSAVKEFQALGLDFKDIQFVVPDEPGRDDVPHEISSDLQQYSEELAKTRLQEFFDEIAE